MSVSLFFLIIFVYVSLAGGQQTSSMLHRKSLERYNLARCNDGTAATYYHDQVKVRRHFEHHPKTTFVSISRMSPGLTRRS